jgi:hypothetical protein
MELNCTFSRKGISVGTFWIREAFESFWKPSWPFADWKRVMRQVAPYEKQCTYSKDTPAFGMPSGVDCDSKTIAKRNKYRPEILLLKLSDRHRDAFQGFPLIVFTGRFRTRDIVDLSSQCALIIDTPAPQL